MTTELTTDSHLNRIYSKLAEKEIIRNRYNLISRPAQTSNRKKTTTTKKKKKNEGSITYNTSQKDTITIIASFAPKRNFDTFSELSKQDVCSYRNNNVCLSTIFACQIRLIKGKNRHYSTMLSSEIWFVHLFTISSQLSV